MRRRREEGIRASLSGTVGSGFDFQSGGQAVLEGFE